MTRNEILAQLREKLSRSQPVRAGLVECHSSGLRLAEDFDLGVLYHTAKFSGLNPVGGLLPFADANQVVIDLAKSRLPADRPVLAGLCGTDPFRLMDNFLEEIENAGFCGIQNFPSVGFIDGDFRAHLENGKIGYGKEVELIALAHERGLLTMPLVFSENDAVQMAHAGADIVVICAETSDANPLTASSKPMLRVETIAAAARRVRKTIIPLVQISLTQNSEAVSQACPGLNGVFVLRR